MIVVCDASPLINLGRISRLALLPALYDQVVLPQAVWEEGVVRGKGKPGAAEVEKAPWVQRDTVHNRALVQALLQQLDAGEAESIVLAMERKDDLLLMDEPLGREVARHLGVRIMGVVGLLVDARHQGLIDSLAEELDHLRTGAGFDLHESLVERIVRDAGER